VQDPAVTRYQPGDVALFRGSALGSRLIQFGTKSRYNHAGIVVDREGRTLEAFSRGADWGRLSRKRGEMMVLRLPLTDEQRARILPVAERIHGTPYSWRGLAAIGLAQFRVRWPEWVKRRLNDRRDLFCSQLVDLVLHDAGFHLYDDGRHFGDVSPGDLGQLVERGYEAGYYTIENRW
jgi:hypothetical protein